MPPAVPDGIMALTGQGTQQADEQQPAGRENRDDADAIQDIDDSVCGRSPEPQAPTHNASPADASSRAPDFR